MNQEMVDHVESGFVEAYNTWHRLNAMWPTSAHTKEVSEAMDEALRVLKLCRQQMGVLHG